jgi:hypothetical protein
MDKSYKSTFTFSLYEYEEEDPRPQKVILEELGDELVGIIYNEGDIHEIIQYEISTITSSSKKYKATIIISSLPEYSLSNHELLLDILLEKIDVTEETGPVIVDFNNPRMTRKMLNV